MIDFSYANKIIDYNPSTGIFLWKHRGDSKKSWNARYAGKNVGTKTKCGDGYVCLCVSIKKDGVSRAYVLSRLAYLIMEGVWPDGEIDHVDGNPLNNRWENLKVVTREGNCRNRRAPKTNTSGVCGVVWHKPSGRWRAQGSINKKRVHLGMFDDLDEARKFITEWRREHGYSERHGEIAKDGIARRQNG